MNKEHMQASERTQALFGLSDGVLAAAKAEGRYTAVYRNAAGEIEWEDAFDNLVVAVGKNLALDTLFAGSAYTVVGPFMGLASAATATATDTMGTKTAWVEQGGANAPTYTAPRKTVTFSAAASGSKASTGTYTFAITSAGTVGGVFMVLGTGAVSTIDSTAGVLYSAGAFTGGAQAVSNGGTLTVTYTASM